VNLSPQYELEFIMEHFNCDGCGLDFVGTPTVETMRGWKWCDKCAMSAFENSPQAWLHGDPSYYVDELVDVIGGAIAA
jgi:hypothetical protein